MKRPQALVIIAAAIFLLAFPFSVQAAPVGTVTALKGLVTITRAEQQGGKDVGLGEGIFIGDSIHITKLSRLEVTFIDGSVARMASNSRLKVTEYLFDASHRKATLDLLVGKIQSVVPPSMPGSSFDVQTPTAAFGVRGTIFFAYFSDGISGGATEEGTVHVYALNNPDQVGIMGPGMAATIASAHDAPAMRSATDQEMQMHRDDTRIADDGEAVSDTEEVDRQMTATETRTLTYLQLAGNLGGDNAGVRCQAYNEAISRMENRKSGLGTDRAEAEAEEAMSKGCFPAEAKLLMEDGTTRRFAEIRPGDMVMTYDIVFDSMAAKPVIEVYTFDANHLFTINGHFETTGTERLLSREGWKTVKRLQPGDMVLTDRGMTEITSIEQRSVHLTVYNIHVADTHNFYVLSEDSGSYLVHNTCGGGGGGNK